MGRIFGTDGARGVANTDLSCELAMSIGRAAAMVLIDVQRRRPRVLIGKDTRVSSDMLEAALIAGLCSVGADVITLGFVPTPAVAYLTCLYKADASIMISASHNPCEYNGLKIFNSEGYKLSDALENEIEEIVLDGTRKPAAPTGGKIGRVTRCKSAVEDYVKYIKSTTNVSLHGMKLAIDCANGAASETARLLFPALGADCMFLSDHPDGININEGCGSTHIDRLSEIVSKLDFDAGIAFDGDADRCLAVDEKGGLVDGDQIIAILATDLHSKAKLDGGAAVVTVMSNLGLFRYFEEAGILPVTTKVGDRYVLEEMRRSGYAIGGEQSGHVIFRHYATTGDGQLTAVQMLASCREQGKKMSELGGLMKRFPQVMKSVKADTDAKARFNADEELAEMIKTAGEGLGREGRVLVRVSGTEPVIRVMVEGSDFDAIDKVANELADAIVKKLG